MENIEQIAKIQTIMNRGAPTKGRVPKCLEVLVDWCDDNEMMESVDRLLTISKKFEDGNDTSKDDQFILQIAKLKEAAQ